jgi:hypothetical protein
MFVFELSAVRRTPLEETFNVCSSDSLEGSSSERSITEDSTNPKDKMVS